MAEVHRIVCDVCKKDIVDGYSIKPSTRRTIRHGKATNENYRFDICVACFNRIARMCSSDPGEQEPTPGEGEPAGGGKEVYGGVFRTQG